MTSTSALLGPLAAGRFHHRSGCWGVPTMPAPGQPAAVLTAYRQLAAAPRPTAGSATRPAATPSAMGSQMLPFTGSDTRMLLAVAGVLLLAGSGLRSRAGPVGEDHVRLESALPRRPAADLGCEPGQLADIGVLARGRPAGQVQPRPSPMVWNGGVRPPVTLRALAARCVVWASLAGPVRSSTPYLPFLSVGWADFQVRSDRAIRRHWALVCCAFSFCWQALLAEQPTQPAAPRSQATAPAAAGTGHPGGTGRAAVVKGAGHRLLRGDRQPGRDHLGDHRQPVSPHQRQHPYLAPGASPASSTPSSPTAPAGSTSRRAGGGCFARVPQLVSTWSPELGC
jgi:hypothetical protein